VFALVYVFGLEVVIEKWRGQCGVFFEAFLLFLIFDGHKRHKKTQKRVFFQKGLRFGHRSKKGAKWFFGLFFLGKVSEVSEVIFRSLFPSSASFDHLFRISKGSEWLGWPSQF